MSAGSERMVRRFWAGRCSPRRAAATLLARERGAARASHPRPGRPGGMTLIEVLIAISLGLLVVGATIQGMSLVMRSIGQASAQADAQGAARKALRDLEREMRDAAAVIESYTLRVSPYTTYTTTVTSTEKTIVAALPALNEEGMPCCWKGVTAAFDCVIWQALKNGDGTWDMTRLTIPGAFRMPTDATAGYTFPTTSGRSLEVPGASLFTGVADVAVRLRRDATAAGILAPVGSNTEPPAYPTTGLIPCCTDSTGASIEVPLSRMVVTQVALVEMSLGCASTAAALNAGAGDVSQTSQERVSICLRNRQAW